MLLGPTFSIAGGEDVGAGGFFVLSYDRVEVSPYGIVSPKDSKQESESKFDSLLFILRDRCV
tara:strand:+ start:731 stop:916 length:186 start_codon:yes stop_codon:yes gene_type:complete